MSLGGVIIECSVNQEGGRRREERGRRGDHWSVPVRYRETKAPTN